MTALIVSQGLLWITVLLMGLVILALARQVGVLHERLAPIGALTTGPGPEIGKPAPRLVVDSMSATKVQIGGKTATGKAQLLFFVSAVCPICKKLIPVSQGFARSEKLDVIFVGDSADAEQRAMIAEYGIDPATFVNDREIGMLYQVGKLPYAVLIDAEGVIAGKGLVNSREHLESLVVSHETGYASIQSYITDKKISVIRR